MKGYDNGNNHLYSLVFLHTATGSHDPVRNHQTPTAVPRLSPGGFAMNPARTGPEINPDVAISDLAQEFDHDLRTFQHWLLRHDFCVSRRQGEITILTAAEATRARFLKTHGVLFEAIRG